MRLTLDEAQRELVKLLYEMGQEASDILNEAVDCLKTLDHEKAKRLIERDKKVNEFERRIDDEWVRMIATQQPVAKDLRKVISAMKISTDLERISDMGVDIAKVVLRFNEPLMKPLIDIPKMAQLAIEMIQQGLEAYVSEDVNLAQGLAQKDDQVDHLYKQVVVDLFEIMRARPDTLNQGMYLSFVGRYLERIADHATNIGENVLYIVTADREDLNS